MPEKPWLYETVDNWSYSSKAIQVSSLLVMAAAFATIGLSVYNGVDEQCVVHNQMHTSMFGAGLIAPSYFTMDWLMTPMPSVTNLIRADLCTTDGKPDCSPTLWQSRTVCSALDHTLNTTETKLILDGIEAPPEVVKEEEHIYKQTRQKYRHISPMHVCQMEKIGTYTMYENNELSWSIGSSHNVYILISGAFGVVALITLSTFIHANRQEDHMRSNNQMFMAFVTFLFIFGTYWYASAASTDIENDYHRPMGMASFVYSSIALVLTLIVFNSDGVINDDKFNTAYHEEKEAERIGDTKMDKEMIPMLGEPQQLNVSGFVSVRPLVPNTQKTGARIVSHNVFPGITQGQGLQACGCLHHPRHSKFIYGQLFVMPLVFLALVLQKHSYGLDTTTQIVALLALSVAIIDCVLYRVWWAFNVQMSIEDSSNGANDTQYYDLIFVTIVAWAVQSTVYIYFILSDLFHDDVMWILIGWLVFATLLKFGAMKAIFDGRDNTTAGRLFDLYNDSAHRLSKADAWIFWTMTVVLAVAVYAELLYNTNDFDHTWLNLALVKDNKPVLSDLWGPRWQTYNHVIYATAAV